MEDFVRVRIADSAEETWIGERALDGVTLTRQRFMKLIARDVERFDTASIERAKGGFATD
jgi:hypothetical protein